MRDSIHLYRRTCSNTQCSLAVGGGRVCEMSFRYACLDTQPVLISSPGGGPPSTTTFSTNGSHRSMPGPGPGPGSADMVFRRADVLKDSASLGFSQRISITQTLGRKVHKGTRTRYYCSARCRADDLVFLRALAGRQKWTPRQHAPRQHTSRPTDECHSPSSCPPSGVGESTGSTGLANSSCSPSLPSSSAPACSSDGAYQSMPKDVGRLRPLPVPHFYTTHLTTKGRRVLVCTAQEPEYRTQFACLLRLPKSACLHGECFQPLSTNDPTYYCAKHQ